MGPIRSNYNRLDRYQKPIIHSVRRLHQIGKCRKTIKPPWKNFKTAIYSVTNVARLVGIGIDISNHRCMIYL